MDDAIAGGSSSEWLLKEPEDQAQARQEEKENVFKSYPILEDVIARLKERVAFYKSVDAVDTTLLTDTDMFMHTIAANKLTAATLDSELQYLEELIKAHVTPQ